MDVVPTVTSGNQFGVKYVTLRPRTQPPNPQSFNQSAIRIPQPAIQTSSSSASSARSMMNRNLAEASFPISSLMMRSVTS